MRSPRRDRRDMGDSVSGVTFRFNRRWLYLDLKTGSPTQRSEPIPLVFTVWRNETAGGAWAVRAKRQAAAFGPGTYIGVPHDADSDTAIAGVQPWVFEVTVEDAIDAGWFARTRSG